MSKQWIITLSLTLAMVVAWVLYSMYAVVVSPTPVNVDQTYLNAVDSKVNVTYINLLKSNGSYIIFNNKSLGINYQ